MPAAFLLYCQVVTSDRSRQHRNDAFRPVIRFRGDGPGSGATAPPNRSHPRAAQRLRLPHDGAELESRLFGRTLLARHSATSSASIAACQGLPANYRARRPQLFHAAPRDEKIYSLPPHPRRWVFHRGPVVQKKLLVIAAGLAMRKT
jgi:hypothetical protein